MAIPALAVAPAPTGPTIQDLDDCSYPGPRGQETAFSTEGKYTQDGGARGLGPVHTPEVEYLPPHPVHGNDLPYAQVAHDLGFTPSPAASVSSTVARLFNFEGHTARVIKDEHGKPWFIGADVCTIHGYSDAHDVLKKHFKHPELLKTGDSPVLGIPPRGMTIISRGDVYRLIIRSQLPEAECFEAWVVDEVLSAINDYGAYITLGTIKEAMRTPGFIIELATQLQDEQENSA